MSESVEQINVLLVENYGKDVTTSLPRLRVVWTSSQYEIRDNPDGFDIYSDGGIFLRTEFGPHEVEKYPLYQDHWVLEVLVPSEENIDGKKYSYEPFWIFGAANSSPQPLWRAIKLLVDAKLETHREFERKKITEQDLRDEDNKKKLKEKETMKMMLQDESPELATALHYGQAVTVPGKATGEDNG